MARQVFYEYILKVTVDDGDTAPATDPMPLFTALSGGTQYTDVQAVAGGGSVTVDNRVTPDAAGRLLFTAADGFTSLLWAEDAFGRRYLVRPALDTLVGPAGAAGPTGPAGATGPTGAPGPAGTAGSVWLSGTAAPLAALGKVSDWYVNTASGDYYEKTATTTWTLRGTFGTSTGAGGGVTLTSNGDGTQTLTIATGSTTSLVSNGDGTATLTY